MATSVRSNMLSSNSEMQSLEQRVMMAAAGFRPVANFSRIENLAESEDSVSFLAGDYTTDEGERLIKFGLENFAEVTFEPGTYTFDDTVSVGVTNNLNVDAGTAKFVSDGVDGDLFKFTGRANPNAPVDLAWTGGNFDISNSKNVADSPFARRINAARRRAGNTTEVQAFKPDQLTTAERQRFNVGDSITADAISIRGRFGNLENGGSDFRHRLDNVLIDGVTINGNRSGGDSGVFVSDANNIAVINSDIRNVQDAGIYITDRDGAGTESAVIANNYIEGSYNGIAAKRGIDNVTVSNNFLVNNVLDLSTQGAGSRGQNSENIQFTDNTVANENSGEGLRLNNSRGDFTGNTFYVGKGNNPSVSSLNAAKASTIKNLGNVKDDNGNNLTPTDLREDNTFRSVPKGDIDMASDQLIEGFRDDFQSAKTSTRNANQIA